MSGTTYSSNLECSDGEFLYVKVGDMNLPDNNFEITTSRQYIKDFSLSHLVPVGSIIFPKRGGAIQTNKKKLVLKKEILIDLNTMALTPLKPLDIFYFYYWFSTINLGSLYNGTSIPQINNKDITPLIIPIPPRKEQERIVSLIPQILSLVNAISQHQSSYFLDVDALKSKILELAIQGKLVEQDENDEPASVLLKHIRAEKKEQLGKKYVESYIYKGDDNCYYEKIGKDCIEITNEINFDVPEKWAVCRFETIANIYTGNSINESEKAKKYTGLADGYNYIATKDISFNHDVDYENGIKIPFSEAKFRVAYKGDPLLCIEGGSAGRKLAVLSEDVCFVNKLCAFHSLGISKKFLYYYLQSPRFLELFKKNTSGLIGGVSINTLKALILTIPPIAEQERIVSKIEKVFSMIDQVEKSLS